MEGYLRLSLLVLAVTIVCFVLWEVLLTYRRKSKMNTLSESYDPHMLINSEHMTNLDPHEPKITAAGFSALDDVEGVGPVRIRGAYESDDVEVIERPVVTQAEVTTEPENDILVLTVAAQAGHEFGSYDLLHAIYAVGLEFGEMNIFHYYDPVSAPKRTALFSLASAQEPGDFDLDKIGNFSCNGLTLFTLLDNVPNPQQAFESMLRAAEQLADDLNGELRAGPHKPWTKGVHQQYLQKVLHYQLKNHA